MAGCVTFLTINGIKCVTFGIGLVHAQRVRTTNYASTLSAVALTTPQDLTFFASVLGIGVVHKDFVRTKNVPTDILA